MAGGTNESPKVDHPATGSVGQNTKSKTVAGQGTAAQQTKPVDIHSELLKAGWETCGQIAKWEG